MVSHREGNTWTITAVNKGRHVVYIVKDDGTRPGEITVIVPNTPPTLNKGANCDPNNPGTVLIEDTEVAATVLTTNNINPGACFRDADDTDDEFRFKVFQKPDAVLLSTDRGFVAFKPHPDPDPDPGFTINPQGAGDLKTEAIILRVPNQRPDGSGEAYQISLSAYDSDGAQSNSPATFTFNTEKPKQRMYSLTKSGTSYKTTKVGNRIGVVHTINLMNSDAGDGIVNYDFRDFVDIPTIKDFIKARDSSYDLASTVAVATTECTLANGRLTNAALQATGAQGLGCWFASISGTEASPGAAFSGGTTIEFQLGKDRRLNDASDVTIIIDYYVVTKARVEADTSADPPVRAQAAQIPKMGSRRLTLDIHPCTTTDDCP